MMLIPRGWDPGTWIDSWIEIDGCILTARDMLGKFYWWPTVDGKGFPMALELIRRGCEPYVRSADNGIGLCSEIGWMFSLS